MTEKADFQNTKGGLSAALTTQLLQDFEDSGEAREEYDLAEYCAKNQNLYGDRGGKTRRQTSFRWNHFLGKNYRSLRAFYKKYNVRVGPRTLALIIADEEDFELKKKLKKLSTSSPKKKQSPKKNSKMAASESNDDVVEELSKEEEVQDEEEEMEGEMDDDVTAEEFQDADGGWGDEEEESQPPPPKFVPRKSVCTTPTRQKKPRQQVTPTRSNHKFGRTSGLGSQSPVSPLVAKAAATRKPLAYRPSDVDATYGIPNGWYMGQDGTDEFPWIIKVDSGGRGFHLGCFDIHYVDKMMAPSKKSTLEYTGWHIRRSIAQPDRKHWKASVPAEKRFDIFYNRIVKIIGPAADFWLDKASKYHGGAEPVNCEGTQKAHGIAERARKQGRMPKHQVFLLVWPIGIELDTSVFSDGKDVIPTMRNPLKSEKNENTTGKVQLGMTVYWKIAMKGALEVGLPSDDEEDDKDAW